MGGRLSGVRVADVMTRDPVVADGTMTLADFVDRLAMSRQFSHPLVDRGGRLTGLVTLNRVRAVPYGRRPGSRLRDIACPPEDVPDGSRPDEPLTALLPRMHGCADGRAVVLDEQGRVIGIVSSTDISRALQLADLRAFRVLHRGADFHHGPSGPVRSGTAG